MVLNRKQVMKALNSTDDKVRKFLMEATLSKVPTSGDNDTLTCLTVLNKNCNSSIICPLTRQVLDKIMNDF